MYYYHGVEYVHQNSKQANHMVSQSSSEQNTAILPGLESSFLVIVYISMNSINIRNTCG